MLAGMPAKKPRYIQQPKPLLDAVHRRIAGLLSRIQKPPFVYSATKGLDYVDNARKHMNTHRGVKVDIKDFYPSVRARLVRTFYEEIMCCAPDVARLLTKICCAGDSLPTGSSVSPLLSYFACSRLFARISAMAAKRNLVFTLYVDDMMFSGEEATRQFASEVVRELAGHGFVGQDFVLSAKIGQGHNWCGGVARQNFFAETTLPQDAHIPFRLSSREVLRECSTSRKYANRAASRSREIASWLTFTRQYHSGSPRCYAGHDVWPPNYGWLRRRKKTRGQSLYIGRTRDWRNCASE